MPLQNVLRRTPRVEIRITATRSEEIPALPVAKQRSMLKACNLPERLRRGDPIVSLGPNTYAVGGYSDPRILVKAGGN